MRLGILLRSPRAAISLMYAINGIVWGTWIARIPAIAENLDVTKAELGSVLPAFAVGALVSLPCAGWLTGRLGSAQTFRFFGIARNLAFPFIAFAPTPAALAGVLFVFGFAHGAVDVSSNSQGVEIERKTRTSILSSVHGCFSLGGLIGAASAGAIAEAGVSVRVQFLTLAVFAIALYLLASRHLVEDEHVPQPPRASGRRLRIALPPRVLWPLGAIAFCVALADESIADWGGLYLTDELGATAVTAALAYTVYSLMMLIGRLSGDTLVRRFGSVRVIAGGGAISAIGLIGGQLTHTILSALLGFGLVGIGLSVILPITYRAAGSTPGIARGSAVASVATIGYVGFMIGPPVIGRLADSASLQVALVMVGGLAIALIPLSRSVARPDVHDDSSMETSTIPAGLPDRQTA